MTLFEKIARREISADIVWEDENAIAFRDLNPQAPLHVLVVPKRCIPRIGEALDSDAELLGRLLLGAQKVAGQLGLTDSGYRIVINNGPHAGETVPHLHLHLLGGRPMAWPPG